MVDPDADEAALVDRITALEKAKSAAAAGQARAAAALDTARRNAEAARGVPAAQRGRGLGSEIGLARHDSPKRGRAHLGFAASWSTTCRTRWRRWRPGCSRSSGPRLIVAEAADLSAADRARLGRRTVRQPERVGRAGQQADHQPGQGDRLPTGSPAVADRAARAPAGPARDHPPGRRRHELS